MSGRADSEAHSQKQETSMRMPLLLTATTCLALGIGSAMAADTKPTTPTTPPAASGTTPGAPATMPRANAPAMTSPTAGAVGMVGATGLVGLDITNAAGDNIGEIKDVVIDGQGQVSKIMLGVGGLLGLGERVVPVSWDQISVTRDADGKLKGTTALGKEEIELLPQYQKDKNAWRPM
jgi:sporulation protein YlmC with PRC-barrel domain